MKRNYLLLLFLFSAACLYAQDGPTTAPKINAFNLNADNLGAIANSVNLFTGDLALPMNLVSIPGQGGIGIDVSLFYSSANIENTVDIWNLDSPTGVVGLGWSMPQSQIIADNKQTGARDDDEFYLVDGGVSTPLICTGNNSGVKSYQTKTFSNTIITYTASTERWEITKEDGSKVIYGDQNNSRNTVQWIVKWGNWIGSSKEAYGQSRQGVIWNLSEMQNLWGGRVYFTYTNTENFVGEGTINHTEASYLTNITDSWGNSVDLFYKNKLADEYTEPHTEQTEPDAYQERYEKKFLDKIMVKVDGNSFYEIRLQYKTNILGSGNLTKRLLTSLTKFTSTGTQLPATTFEYLTTGAMKGVMNTVKTQTGGGVTFEYSGTAMEINHSSRELTITAPSGYSEPRVFIENDYTIVTWRQYDGSTHNTGNKTVLVEVYSWEGEWKKASLGNVGSPKYLTDHDDDDKLIEQDFLVATGKDFFAMLRPLYGSTSYSLYLWHKDERVPGAWIPYTESVELNLNDNETADQIFAGENFVAVTNGKGRILRYTWNGAAWSGNHVTETNGTYFTTVSNNFILTQYKDADPDQLKLYYLDEQNSWQTKSMASAFNNGSLSSYWHSSNGLAVGMIDQNNEFIVHWDENYNLSEANVGFGFPDNSYVFINNESLVSLITPSSLSGIKMRSLRFNGSSWVDTGEKTIHDEATSSVGEDLILWQIDAYPPDQIANRKIYNPNLGLWGGDLNYSYSSNSWNSSEAGIRSFAQNDRLYFINNDGSLTDVSSPFNSISLQSSARLGTNYYAISGLQFRFIKNGQLVVDPYEESNRSYYVYNSISLFSLSHISNISLITNNTLLTCSTTTESSFENTTSLKIHRIQNYGVSGKQSSYPIIRVTTNDGVKNYYTSFSYDLSTAVVDPSGISPMFNKVTTVPGSSSPSTKPFGYTETYFFNRLSGTELGDTFPNESPLGNAPTHFKLLTGQSYRSKVFNASGTVVSESSTVFNVENTIYAGSWVFLPHQYKAISTTDGIEVETEYSYQFMLQRPAWVNTKTKYASGATENVKVEYTYASEKYASCLAKNIMSPVVQTKKYVNGSLYTQSAVTRWKDWTCSGPNCIYADVPSPIDRYAWKTINSEAFTVWDPAQTPSSDWLFQSKINNRDNTNGAELEVLASGGQISSQLMDEKKRTVSASVSNAGLSNIAFTSFEDAATGNWSWSDGSVISGNSKTGGKYMTLGTSGLSKSGLNSDERYTVSLWVKSNGGSISIDGVGSVNLGALTDWTLLEYAVSGLSSIGIRKNGSTEVQLDEVRLHPFTARMNTSTYHPFFGTTSQTDNNNQTVYTEYDDVGRVKNVLDENRNIVETYLYNLKK